MTDRVPNISRLLSESELCGRLVAISGATGGLGRELCRALCLAGASLMLLDRNDTRSAALADELKAEFDGADIERLTVDLEDMARVRQIGELLLARKPFALILNAGAYCVPRRQTTWGCDNIFAINFLAPYYLARRLIEASAATRIVVVGSVAHNYSHIDTQDLQRRSERRASIVYGNAKRMLMFSLSGREGVAITHPGITVTNITAHYPPLLYALIKYPMKLIFMSPKKAARCILAGLFCDTPRDTWIGPRIFNVWGAPKRAPINTCGAQEWKDICKNAEVLYQKAASAPQEGGADRKETE